MKGLMWEVCEGGECKEECEEGWVVKREGWEERSGGWVPRRILQGSGCGQEG